MSTRDGNYIRLEEVIDLTKSKVLDLMKKRNLENNEPLEEESIGRISEAIAVGAVVYHDLHTDPARDVEFDVNRAADFEGETGPYLQYAHTRCRSILKKAADHRILFANSAEAPSLISFLTTDEEVELVKRLGSFSFHLERTLSFAKASHLTSYLIDVSKAFGAFYRECKVIHDSKELEPLSQARLQLVEATRRILGRGLELLGIPIPDRM